MSTEKRQCAEMVYSSSGAIPIRHCKRNAIFDFEGKMYCAYHHPPTAEAKRKAREERYVAEAKVRNLIRDREREIAAAKEAVVEAALEWSRHVDWGIPIRLERELRGAVARLEEAERGQ